MPVGLSDGVTYKDESEWLANMPAPQDIPKSIPKVVIGPKFDTELTPEEQPKYEAWKAQNAPNDSGADYDLRGAFKAGVMPAENGHWPDTFKKPNHPTFSVESQYAKDAPELAGSWQGETYIPPSTASTMPLGASTEPAGALKLSGGTQTPENGQKVKSGSEAAVKSGFFERLSLVNTVRGMLGGAREAVTNLPENVAKGVSSAIDAAALPGDVFLQNVDPTSDYAVEKAADLAGLMIFGPAPVAGKLADGTLGSFAGVKSKTFDKNALAHAQVLEANAIHPDDIFTTTGMFRGREGRWRYEIDDSKAKYTPSIDKPAGLNQVLDHPDLFKAYPELSEIRVVVDSMYPKGGAQWEVGSKSNRATIRMGIVAAKDKGILMHEVQHAIQEIEGFSKGGTAGKVGKDFQLKYEPDIQALRPEYNSIQGKIFTHQELTDKELARYIYLSKVMDKYTDYVREANRQSFTNYLRLAGETEARNTQTRLEMTKNWRRNVPPIETEDIFRQNQIPVYESVATTAYGVKDPISGKIMKSEPTQFRRGANDNLPEGHPDRPYNVREPNMLGSIFEDNRIFDSWNDFAGKNIRGNEILDQMAKIREVLDTRNFNDIEWARYKKLADEHEKLFPK